MAVEVTGVLTDLGGVAIPAGQRPELWFKPNRAGRRGGRIFTNEPIKANLSGSSWSVMLEVTTGTMPEIFYTPLVKFYRADGTFVGQHMIEVEIRVPAGGGSLSDINGEFRFWVGPTYPFTPDEGNLWIDTSDPFTHIWKERVGMAWVSKGTYVGPAGTVDIASVTLLAPTATSKATVSGPPSARRLDLELAVPAGGLTPAQQTIFDQVVTKTTKLGESVLREVSGTVELSATDPRIVEMYTVGSTTILGETFPADVALVARRTASGAWQRWLVGESQWRAFSASNPAAPETFAPTAPTFNDRSGTANDTTTIPNRSGVNYRINGTQRSAGTYNTTGTVTVEALPARSNVTLLGQTSWTMVFLDVDVPEWTTTPVRANFTQADTGAVGIYHDPTRPTLYPPVYTDDSGKIWNALTASGVGIAGNKLVFTAGSPSTAHVRHGVTGDVSLKLTYTTGAGDTIRVLVQAPGTDTSESTGVGVTLTSIGQVSLAPHGMSAITYNKDGGTAQFTTIPGFTTTATYALRVERVGDRLSVYVNDALYLMGTVSSARIGTVGSNPYLKIVARNGAVFDSVEMRAA
ncbi:hypothetical protein [Pseudoclavibacter sp. JSM 162008]|uniref:hypothetical protein n=1 Tax=Pseudoclavibacter sp. JSM 162008 TaxID=3229855 RepID=UPI00352652AA